MTEEVFLWHEHSLHQVSFSLFVIESSLALPGRGRMSAQLPLSSVALLSGVKTNVSPFCGSSSRAQGSREPNKFPYPGRFIDKFSPERRRVPPR